MPKFDVIYCSEKVGEIIAINLGAAVCKVRVGVRKEEYPEGSFAEHAVDEHPSAIFDAAADKIGTPLDWAGE